MAKQNKGRRRRKNSKHYSDSDDEHLSDTEKKDADSKSPKNAHNKSELSFAEKRELQRKAAAEKRRQKMKVCKKNDTSKRFVNRFVVTSSVSTNECFVCNITLEMVLFLSKLNNLTCFV